jgi:uncharacterized protein YpuA (DUF1002 family)
MKQSTKKTAAALGAAGATMAAAAGAYYLYGSEKAAAHRRKVGAWMRRAEREIVHEAKRLKNAAYTDQNIRRVIDEVAKRYESARDLDPKDVKQFVAAVQKSWKDAGKVVKNRVGVRKSAPRKRVSAKKKTSRTSR